MIKKMVLKNVYTFTEEIIIDFASSINIYAIFGGNGSGKTNIINIIKEINRSLNGELDFEKVSKMKSVFTKKEEMQFCVRYEIKGILYDYNLVLDSEKVLYQSILLGDKKIIEYDIDEESQYCSDVLDLDRFTNFDASKKGVMPLLQLFDDKEIIPFLEYIECNFSSKRRYGVENKYKKMLEFAYLNNNVKEEIQEELKKIDVGVEKLNILFDEENDSYKVTLKHNSIDINLRYESNGTQKYFELMLNLLYDTKHFGSEIYMIDELEKAFHPLLTKYFIQYFKKCPEVQFIFTSHNYDILDEKLLPAKSIFFLQKQNNSTELFCLNDFKLRSDDRHNWKKMYFQNRIGGLPYVEIRD